MFGRSITLFRLFGFAVRIDASWLLIAALISWSLAVWVFPQMYPDLGGTAYWLMGLAGVVALFFSVVLHEFSHSVVARWYGIPMKGITLFIFGGVAEMHDEPPSPKVEFLMAIAGPIASVFIAIGFGIGFVVGSALQWPVEVTGVLGYFTIVNIMLAIFNMIPAFPLDGGRVLRAGLWYWKGSLRKATKIAARAGSMFGLLLVVLGVVALIMNQFVGGLWWILIGLFINSLAGRSYQQVLIRQALSGEPVSRFMRTDPVTVPRSISVRDLVDEYIYRYHYKLFPVVEGERLLGCVTTRQIREMPREEWDRQTVGAVAASCSSANSIPPDLDAMRALGKMHETGATRLMVVEGDRLLGLLTLKDLLRFLSVKIELEEEQEGQ
jgi:Zn-dependent protease/CBS domain-containing protein